MWTDEYISRQLLAIHLDQASNAASRKMSCIEQLVGWIQGQIGRNSGEILDLGCGPGLYAEKLAGIGYKVTGVDFSQNSIEYARGQAERQGLDIAYRALNYLDMDYREQFDAMIMVYCDFGVLSVAERDRLLNKILRALKPNGLFIFDALNEAVLQRLQFEKTWTMANQGFWLDKPYLCLREMFHYPENKATLDQYIVLDENDRHQVYRFWNHYFSVSDIRQDCVRAGFSRVESFERLLGERELYNDSDVTFYKAIKSG